MTNLGQMMKQAQEMQDRMAEIQEKLSELEITGSAGGGMVDVTLTGKHEVRRVKIEPELADPENLEMLEDLIVAAVNDARIKVEKKVTPKPTAPPVTELLKNEFGPLNEWSEVDTGPKRWFKKMDGEGLTEFEKRGGKDSVNEARYKTISLKSAKGFKEAEKLQKRGWKVAEVGLFTINMVKK